MPATVNNDDLKNKAPARKEVSPLATMRDFLTRYQDQLTHALPDHLKADRMVRLALTAFSQNKQLQDCDPKTVFASVLVAAQMGLEIGVAGQCYLVPYKRTCQCIPGWQGYVDLVSRSGRAAIWTGAVFKGDDFDYEMGDRPFIKHKPKGDDDPDNLLYTYSVGRVNGSDWPIIDVWPVAKVERHLKKNNKVGPIHYANKNFEMYARKIPLLQVVKYLPKSVHLANAITADAAADSGRGMTIDGEFVTLDPPDDGGDAPEQTETTKTETKPEAQQGGASFAAD